MRKFKGQVSTGIVGSSMEFTFEIDDDATDAEIEDAARDAMFECIDWNYEEQK